MTLRVPYIADESIERDAEALLVQFAHARGVAIGPPIPIEDIVEKHLKLHVEFDDLHRLLGVPRGGFGTEPDIFGAIWLETARSSLTKALIPRCGRRSRGVIALRSVMRAAGTGGCTDRWSRQTAVKSPSSGIRDVRSLFVDRVNPRSGLRCRPIYMLRAC
jgi:hypothetical protein